MPTVSLWFIRLGFVYLLLFWVAELGRFLLLHFWELEWVWVTRAGRFHLFFVGWPTQLIFGVAHWMFPTKNRQELRGNESLVMASLVLLNVGLLLRLLAEPMQQVYPGTIWVLGLVLSAALQWLGMFLFTWNIWGRIKGKAKKKRGKGT